jgi:hypothetical protein
MRAEQFRGILNKLRLQPASKRAAKAFGVSLRTLQRITAGGNQVPTPVALLAIAYSKYGLPDPLWNPDVSHGDKIKEATANILKSMAPLPPVQGELPSAGPEFYERLAKRT